MRARQPYDWANPATLATNRAGKLTDEQRMLVGVNRARGQARDDAVAGRIVQAQGQVTWDGVRYVAEVPRRRLRTLRRSALPAPGPYAFCYLARSGVLLSAEPLRGVVPPVPGSEPARRALIEALARTLRFSRDDLAANRAGRLSAVQRRRLLVDAADTFFGTLGGVAGALTLVLGGLAAATYTFAPRFFPGQTAPLMELVEGQQKQSVSLPLLLEGALALLAVLLVVGSVAAMLAARPILHDAWGGRAAAIEGEVDAESGMIRAATVYYYVMRTRSEDGARRQMRFVVSPLAYRALIGGQPVRQYRLYYAPHLHTLLSIEPLAVFPVS